MQQQSEFADLNFDAYSNSELVKLLNELTRKVELLDNENLMFEKYLGRVDTVKEEKSEIQQEQEKENTRRAHKKKGEKQKEQDKPISLSLEQKIEISLRELEEIKDEIENSKEEWAKVIDNCKAELEEVEIRITETKKAMYEFKRDIVTQAINQRTGKVMAERVVRYYEDKIRGKKNKLHLQLKQKEEMGEVLHAIDFDQLQIENKQYLQKIEERNKELLKLKMTAGNTVQILNKHKKRLQAISLESQKIAQEISQRKELLSKLESEEKKVEQEKQLAEKRNAWLIDQIEQYKAPDVLSYVMIRATQTELQKKLRVWERKAEIAQMQADRMRKIWNKMKTAEKRESRVAQAKLPTIVQKLVI